MRQLKREKVVAETLEDKDELKKINNKIKSFNTEYDNFLKQNNLRRDYSREFIEKGLVENSIDKEIFEESIPEKYAKLDNQIEHMMIFDINTNKQIGKTITGNRNTIDLDYKSYWTIMTSKKNSLFIVHNHPNNTSFSFKDIRSFNNYKSIGAIGVYSGRQRGLEAPFRLSPTLF